MAGSRTPAWGAADGSRTVNSYADGNRTAYGGGPSGGVSLRRGYEVLNIANIFPCSERQHGIPQGQGITIRSVEAGLLATSPPGHQRTIRRRQRQGITTVGRRRMARIATTARTMHPHLGRICMLRLHQTEATLRHQQQRRQHLNILDTRWMRQRRTVVNLKRQRDTQEMTVHATTS